MKTLSDLFAPISGKVTRVNGALENQPSSSRRLLGRLDGRDRALRALDKAQSLLDKARISATSRSPPTDALPAHTPEEVELSSQRSAAIGSPLFETIPEAARFNGRLAVPEATDEAALMAHMRELGSRNTATSMLSFIGAGMYSHHIPPAVDQLLLRSEFYTAYTPYQPEVAQGTLQAIWEFQTT